MGRAVRVSILTGQSWDKNHELQQADYTDVSKRNRNSDKCLGIYK